MQDAFSLPRARLNLAHCFLRSSGDLALEKVTVEEDKIEIDDNARTIRPSRSPQGPAVVPLPSASFSEPDVRGSAAVEDYSDVLFDDDDDKLEEKVADFKVRRYTYAPALNVS